jgi:hypothetical protein
VTFFCFRKGEWATDFPAANVYAAKIAWVRAMANSLFALLAAIIAAWVTGRYQLTGNFRWQQRGAIQFDAQSGRLVPREIEEKQTARLVVKMPKGDDVS